MNESTTKEKTFSVVQFVSTASLPLLIIVAVIVFSILCPNTYPTAFNVKSILNNQAVNILVALAVMVPIINNNFDMSVGYGVCLYHILLIGMMVNMHLPWPIAIVLILLLGACVGFVNGMLVTRLNLSAFIATLGTGFILYGFAFMYSGGAQIVGVLPNAFIKINSYIGIIPTTFIIAMIVALILFIVYDYTPVGRYMYFIGSNPKAAQLSGIPVKKYLICSFIVSSLLASLAAIVLQSIIRVGQISVGPDYTMPGFAAALMGSVAIRPGKTNVWGTVFAVLLLACVFAGLKQMGAQYYVEPLFNGAILVISVALAEATRQRRATSIKK